MPRYAVARPWPDQPKTCVAPCRRWAALGLAAAGLAAAAAPAAAQTGGTSPPPAPAAERRARARPRRPRTSTAAPRPRISRIACRTSCGAAGEARPGSLVRVYGRSLRKIDEVIFLGADGEPADDASVAPRTTARRSLLARVPRTALTGRLAVARADGTRSPATPAPLTVRAAPDRRSRPA